MRQPGVDRSSPCHLTQRLCHHILEEGLLPTNTPLISYYTGRGTIEGDPLLAAIGTLGQCLINLGLLWALPYVPILGLGPALLLCDYLQGLG